MLTISVPQGDLSLLSQLPALYQHCKATEDPDMNWFDFITDHLINIDGLFDRHLLGDDQKPHQPFHFHLSHMVAYVAGSFYVNFSTPLFWFSEKCFTRNKGFHSRYNAYVFHPPQHSSATLLQLLIVFFKH